ncbi:MAG: serine/threonine-protein kinase [Planctomycetota bacterium]
MKPDALHARASALFVELRNLPEPARSSRLDALAALGGDDSALACEVRSLLQHDLDDGSAPQSPTDDGHVAADSTSGPVAVRPPTRLGPYRLVRRIGRGGSGHVFLAEQDEPLRRRVAVKLVPQAALDPDLAARFDVERRALERLAHRNVVRLLDAGRTPDGLPFLVMDYVAGEPLTEYCTHARLPLGERVRLLLQVADGVEYAHQRGVIHRDLKPANVVVATADGAPTPIVLDFGIAKARAGAFTAPLPLTGGFAMGTPGYMAPEQAALGEIDTRADVYALGALLYELVCGQPPIAPGPDLASTFARLRDHVPPPPSRRLAGTAAAAGAADSALLADLDAIALRALEKEPERRYPSVSAWRADVQRALRAQPIEARPPTWTYRVRCFVRRERRLALALLGVATALVVGMIGLALGLATAERERGRALDEKRAQEEINTFLAEDVLGATAPDQLGPDANILQLMQRASERIEPRFANRPLIAAALYHTLGDIYGQLGELDRADEHLQRAVALRRARLGPDATETIHSEIAAASVLGRRERYAELEATLTPLVARARRQLGPDDSVLYAALNDLGVARIGLGREADAIAPLTEAVAGRRRLHGAAHAATFTSLGNLALVRSSLGPAAEAITALEAAIAAAHALPDPPRAALLGLENNLGATLQDLERNADAKPHLEAAAALAAQMFPPDHSTVLQIRANLAGLQADLGDPLAAMAEYADLVPRLARTVGAGAEATLSARHGQWTCARRAKRLDEAVVGFTALLDDVVKSLSESHLLTSNTRQSLAVALRDAGRVEEALPHAERAAEEFAARLGREHPRVVAARALVRELQDALPARAGAHGRAR